MEAGRWEGSGDEMRGLDHIRVSWKRSWLNPHNANRKRRRWQVNTSERNRRDKGSGDNRRKENPRNRDKRKDNLLKTKQQRMRKK
jgi:hypothetical protein